MHLNAGWAHQITIQYEEDTVKFVQLIEMRTKQVDEIQRLEDEWERATEGKRTLRKSIVGRDRNDPDRHIVIAFFDDYDSAMTNSNLPETQTFGERQSALLEAPPTFTDLDIIDERD
jgi:quinol monooxygenase YgiN